MKRSRLWAALGILCGCAALASMADAAELAKRADDRRVAHPFNLNQVRLLDGPIREYLELNAKYLRSLDTERQLHIFRLTAGLPTTAEPLGGWEAPDQFGRGEFFGHSLSARAMLYAITGDKEVKAKLDYLVSELAKCQKALGTSGYLHAEPESYFDKLEKGENVQGIYYTVHKLMAGLLDVYSYCDNAQALEVAEGMARWVHTRSGRFSPQEWERIIAVEFGGINEALYNLYAITGKPEHLAAARRFDHEVIYGPLAAAHDQLTGLHANTTIPKIVGAARAYEITGDTRFQRIAEYFWDRVALDRSYCTGGTSNFEHWRTPAGVLACELSHTTQECCCTYNMLKLTRHLFMWNPDARIGDFYERAFFNGILGTMNPADGMTMYSVPLASGWWKTFGSQLDSFWCCTGTGVESFTKLADSIYFHDDDGLWVNLFVPSELTWSEKGLKIRQETKFPDEPCTSLVFNATGSIKLKVRVRAPYWLAGKAEARVNGKAVETGREKGYLVVERQWSDGDRLEITLPMRLHLAPMQDDSGLAGVMYGPLVLAGRLGLQGLTPDQLNMHTSFPEGRAGKAPWFVSESDDPASWVRPVVGKSLEFETYGQAENITLVPFNRLFGERYGIYWRIYRNGSPQHEARLQAAAEEQRLAARIVDTVTIGDDESEEAHAMAGEKTDHGEGMAGAWRHALPGGWFAYRLKVVPDQAMVLRCTYWGDDAPPRKFDILIDGRKLASQSLNHDRPGELFTVEYPMPKELIEGRQAVEVRFQPDEQSTAGGLFGLWTMKAGQ